MSLRDQQKELTRDLIIDALVDVVVEQGPRNFAMEAVAEQAGVSLRTLYRYYPGREELLAALIVRLNETMQLTEEQERLAETLGGCVDLISQRLQYFSEHERLSRAALAIIAGSEGVAEDRDHEPLLQEAARQRATRHAHMRRLVDEEFADFPKSTRDQLFAVVRAVVSMVGWGQMTGPAGGLDGPSAGVAAKWAFQVLVRRMEEMREQGIFTMEEDL